MISGESGLNRFAVEGNISPHRQALATNRTDDYDCYGARCDVDVDHDGVDDDDAHCHDYDDGAIDGDHC